MKYNIVDDQLPFQFKLARCAAVSHAEPFRVSKDHGRELYAFIHIMKGWIEYRFFDGQPPMRLTAQQTVFVPKGCRYECLYPVEETAVTILEFDLAEQGQELPGTVVLLPENAGLLFWEFKNPHTYLNSLRCAGKLYELLDQLLQSRPATAKKYRRLLPAIEHMERDPQTDADVGFYAELCDMSTSAFRRSFRDHVGVSPIEYRNDLRLRYAKMLLTSGEYSVEETAHRSGFNNISFFYRLFRRKFGCSPGKF